MSSDDDQKRHIKHVISAIRDDDPDADGESPRTPHSPPRRPAADPDVSLESDDEYYADDDERRQWDYEESNPATLEADLDDGKRERGSAARPAGLGMLLDWRLVAALVILVAGLFMVNLSGDGDAASTADAALTPEATARIEQLEARLEALEQRLAGMPAEGAGGDAVLVGAPLATGDGISREELQILRDQVNAGLKAQEEATRSAVQGLERRLVATIDEKVAAARPSAPAAAPTARSSSAPAPAANGGWFVNVATYSQRATADAMVKRLQETGRTAVIVPATIGGESAYRVRVTNLSSRDAAQTAARQLESEFGLRGLWVGES